MVNVNNEGLVSLEGGGGSISCVKRGNTVMLSVEFDNDQEAKEFFHIMLASIEVRCVHIHFGPIERIGRTN